MTRGVRAVTKTCEGCGSTYSAMAMFFDRTKRGGLTAKCKWCRRGVKKKVHHTKRPKPEDRDGERRCEKCGQFKPLADAFTQMPRSINGGAPGFLRVCKSCRKDGYRPPEDIVCNSCCRLKPACDFDGARSDKYVRKTCKTCRRLRTAMKRRTKSGRAALLKYNRSEKGRAADRKYKNKPAIKERKRILNRAYYKSHRGASKAWSKVMRLLRKGELVRLKHCQSCGRAGNTYAYLLHGPQHISRYDILWCCPRCHRRRTIARKWARNLHRHKLDKNEWEKIHRENVAKIKEEQEWLAARFLAIERLSGRARAREERRINVEYAYFECADRADIARKVLQREGW